jgi:hypothetical protein
MPLYAPNGHRLRFIDGPERRQRRCSGLKYYKYSGTLRLALGTHLSSRFPQPVTVWGIITFIFIGRLGLFASGCWKTASLAEGETASATDDETADLALLWVRQIGSDEAGSAGDTSAREIALLPDGSVAILGRFDGRTVFSRGGPDAASLTSAGGRDFFVAKYGPGGRLAWAIRGGGPEDESIGGLATHPEGGVIASLTCSEEMSFSTTGIGRIELAADGRPACLARLTDGGRVEWLVTAGSDWAWGLQQPVTVTPQGDIVIANLVCRTTVFGVGQINETVVEIDSDEVCLGVVAAFDAGGAFKWLRPLHDIDSLEDGYVWARDITAKPNGTLLLAGAYEGRPLVGVGTPAEIRLGFSDESEAPFVAELTADGELIYVLQGESPTAWARSVAPLADGGIVITGTYQEELVLDPDGSALVTLESPFDEEIGLYDWNGFVARYGPSHALGFARGVEGRGGHYGERIVAFPDGGYAVLGNFSETVAFDPFSAASGIKGSRYPVAVYIAAFDTHDNTAWLSIIDGSVEVDVGDAVLSSGKYLYVTGEFSGVVSFGRTGDGETLTSRGGTDAYLAKYELRPR